VPYGPNGYGSQEWSRFYDVYQPKGLAVDTAGDLFTDDSSNYVTELPTTGSEFDLPITHQELASRLGTVREVVSRNLARFRAEGLIRIQGHQLQILDRAGLERESEPTG